MELSIIVPIRNGEKYLKECVDSILAQKFQDFELILINNGSNDSSAKIIDEYVKKDNRIVKSETNGLRVNEVRKVGIDISKGEYVGFVDCDDWVDDNMYFDLMNIIKMYDLDVVSSGMIKEFVEEKRIVEESDNIAEGVYDKKGMRKYIYPNMLSKHPFFTFGVQPNLWNKIFKSDIINDVFENLDLDIIYGEDATVVYAALLKANKIALVKKGYYHYRIHSKSNTYTVQPEFLMSAYKLHSQLKKTFMMDEQSDVLLNQLDYYTINTSIFNLKMVFGVDIFSKMKWVMPFKKEIHKKRIGLWGAGDIGQSFYKQILDSNSTKDVVWVDQSVKLAECEIRSPEILEELKPDVIIIGIYSEQIKEEIVIKLHNMGFKDEQIFWEKYEKRMEFFGL